MTNRRDYIRWARAAVANHQLDPTAAHVLLLLATYANGDGWAWPSRDTLVDDTATSRSTMSRALTRLRRADLVESQPAAPGRPSRHRLTMPPLDNPEAAPDVTHERARTAPDVTHRCASSPLSGPAPAADVTHQRVSFVTHQRPSLPNVTQTRVRRGSNEAHRCAPEVGSGKEKLLSPSPPSARASEPVGEAPPGGRANHLFDDEDDLSFAERIRGVLERAVDGLPDDEPSKRPTDEAILHALGSHPLSRDEAMGVAVEVRSICQSQGRAPNIAGLYAMKVAEAARASAVEARTRRAA